MAVLVGYWQSERTKRGTDWDKANADGRKRKIGNDFILHTVLEVGLRGVAMSKRKVFVGSCD